MTDTELNEIEAKAKAATPGPWEADEYGFYGPTGIVLPQNSVDCEYCAVANPSTILELIAELRQIRAERDWLARIFGTLPDRECPPNRRRWSMECSKVTCEECWLQAAKEATCITKNP